MSRCPFASRRGFLAGASLAAFAGAARAAGAGAAIAPSAATVVAGAEPFFGAHQGGILTRQQSHTVFAAFDLTATSRGQVADLLRAWTDAAARMTAGDTAAPLGDDPDVPASDSGEALGLPPARLTLTFGFGPTLFVRDGIDRYGLRAQMPAALAPLPRFNGDQLVEARSGGDLSVQACADDQQVAFHAIRQLARIGYAAARLRWMQTGFASASPDGGTPRNLMGFKDGTQNPGTPRAIPELHEGKLFTPGPAEDILWVGDEGPAWMRGGSYLVVRRIRMALEHWERTDTSFQEQVIGRHKRNGAPLGSDDEFAVLDLDAQDGDGNPRIPDDAHVRLGSASVNGGATILRRGYSYNDGLNFTAERWPPWRQGLEFDAGLLFIAYQRDPRTGFVRIFEPMSKLDALNQFTTHVGSGLFACPPGAQPGASIGAALIAA